MRSVDSWSRGKPASSQKSQQTQSKHVVAGATIILTIFLIYLLRDPSVETIEEKIEEKPTGVHHSKMVDMHTHTTESDGDRTAEEQILTARDAGLKSIWITDHDMIRDLSRTHELQEYGRRHGVNVGFGVEITIDWNKKEHHLLGYFPDSAWSRSQLSAGMLALQRACAEVKSSRENRNNMMVAFLNELLKSDKGRFYFLTAEAHHSFQPLVVATVASWAKDHANLLEPTSLGRPHFSKYLQEVTVVNPKLIFGPRAGDGIALLGTDGNVYFDEAKTGMVGIELEALMHSATLAKRNIAFEPLPIVDAITAINAAGGRAVIAHPPTLGPKWAEDFGPSLPGLRNAGLWGIEAYSSEIDEANHRIIAKYAIDNGLVMTGGSDNHGSLKFYAKLGDVHRYGQDFYKELENWAREGAVRSEKMRNDDL